MITPANQIMSLGDKHTPAVYDGGSGGGWSIHVVPDHPGKLDQGLGALWDSVVGPHGVVEVTQHPRVTAAALLSGFIDHVLLLLHISITSNWMNVVGGEEQVPRWSWTLWWSTQAGRTLTASEWPGRRSTEALCLQASTDHTSPATQTPVTVNSCS